MRRALALLAFALYLASVLLSLPVGGSEGTPPEPEEYDPAWDVPATEYAYIDLGETLGEFVLTAYCPCRRCCGKEDGITATGTHATEGRTIAVDPRVIPYGSTVTIHFADGSSHSYIAEDCGGGIRQNRIDVFFESHQAALEFGVQRAYVCLEG